MPYKRVKEFARICHIDVETKFHFLLERPLYNDLMNIMLAYIILINTKALTFLVGKMDLLF